MIYTIARLIILGMRSIQIEKTERSDTINLSASGGSIFNLQFRFIRVGYHPGLTDKKTLEKTSTIALMWERMSPKYP